ncbi:glycosyltransferase family 2 protein [Pseudodesulfovibrio sp.]|uniref:glycosyltransferase family 2 protein n=1 Tax=unclassified Pseudodesulfovibrio TaxID=2661612 RepID=UPI003B00E267
MPKLSVLMPVYNGQQHLAGAIESVLNQDFADFEFLVVDDASTDNSRAILEAAAGNDSRIRLLRHDKNQGVAAALNTGIQAVRGEYVARQDSDDISLPGRFKAQTEFLDAHPEVGVVCGDYVDVNDHGKIIARHSPPRTNHLIAWHLCVGHNPIPHPLVMFRTAVVRDAGGYDPAFACEDYELWCRLIGKTAMAAPAIPGLQRLYHRNQISRVNSRRLYDSAMQTLLQTGKRFLDEELSVADRQALLSFTNRQNGCSPGFLEAAVPLQARFACALVKKFTLNGTEQEEMFREMAALIAAYPASGALAKDLDGRDLSRELWQRITRKIWRLFGRS